MMIGLELPNMSNQQGPGRLLLIFLTKSFVKDSNHVTLIIDYQIMNKQCQIKYIYIYLFIFLKILNI